MFTLRYTGPSVRESHFNQTLHLNCRLSETQSDYSSFRLPQSGINLRQDYINEFLNNFFFQSPLKIKAIILQQPSNPRAACNKYPKLPSQCRQSWKRQAIMQLFQLVKSSSFCLSCGTSLKRLSLTLMQFGALQLKKHVLLTLLLPQGPVSIVLLSKKKIGRFLTTLSSPQQGEKTQRKRSRTEALLVKKKRNSEGGVKYSKFM